MPGIIDTHCHYNLAPLYADWQNHWQAAQDAGVTASIVVGTDLETSLRALEIASKEPYLFPTIGLHPTDITEQSLLAELPNLQKLISPEVVAIGEIGLDYYRLDKQAANFQDIRHQQQQALIVQLSWATTHQLPVILHVRDTSELAYWDIHQIMLDHWPKGSPFVLHCISGPVAYLEKMLELGAYVGVAGNVTYPNAAPIRELMAATPVDRLLLETDAPFLTPQTNRGQACEPWMIGETATFIGQRTAETTVNALRLFPQVSQ